MSFTKDKWSVSFVFICQSQSVSNSRWKKSSTFLYNYQLRGFSDSFACHSYTDQHGKQSFNLAILTDPQQLVQNLIDIPDRSGDMNNIPDISFISNIQLNLINLSICWSSLIITYFQYIVLSGSTILISHRIINDSKL